MFETAIFASPIMLALGALTGLLFGFLLQKGRVAKYETIVGQFLLRDFTVLKIMLTAVIVGGIGVYGMLQLGMLSGLHVKGAVLLANALGGAIFGAGMAILGYCPGTGVAALAEGARDALWGVLGMVVGAAFYAEAHPWLAEHVHRAVDLGKVTLPELTGLSPWVFFVLLAAVAIPGFRALGKLEKHSIASASASKPKSEEQLEKAA